MRKVYVLSLGLLILSLWWTKPLSAQDRFILPAPPPGGMMMMGDGPGMMFPMMLKKLELTPAQDTRVREIMAAHRQTFRTLFKQLEAAHEAMTDKFFTAGELSTADLTQQTQNVKQLREQLTNEGINVAMEIRSVLTAEQLAKAAQLKDRMREMHAEMRSLFEEKD